VAYYTTQSLPFLAGVLLLTAVLSPARKAPLRPLDWGMLLILLYEVPSLWLSRFPANGMSSARIVCSAVLFYFAFRLAAGTPKQTVLISALLGAGGVALAGFALSRFDTQFDAMQAAGFSDLVAFRARLIPLGPRWVLGEWFTLLLATLPFAFAAPMWLWIERRRALAMAAAPMPMLVTAALLLSCSRAIFWGVLVFAVSVAGISAAYRVLRARSAAVLLDAVLAAAGAILLVENAGYPGIAGAYLHRQTSQIRSTEGRLAVWGRSADVFRLSPVWGVGSGNAALFLASSTDRETTTGFAGRTYSLPLQLLAEKGVLGLGLYAAVLALAGWEARRKLRNPRVSPEAKALTSCLAAGVIAVLFRELTYSSLLEHEATAMLFTMSLALLAAEVSAWNA